MSYDSLEDPTVLVKMYAGHLPRELAISEYEASRKIYALGIATPEPGKLVTDGERIGIMFKRVKGKRSYSRMLSDEPERIEELSREFARVCKRLHSTHCPEGLFEGIKEQSLRYLEHNTWLSEEVRERMADFIRKAPEADTCLHGDMQIGNVISTLPKGASLDTPHDILFIDLGFFSRGCPLFDLGMMQCICIYADESYRQRDFHVNGEVTSKVWRYFLDEYFFSEDALSEKYFGKGQTVESVDRAILPYFCCKLLMVGYDIGFLPPHFLKVIEEVFSGQWPGRISP